MHARTSAGCCEASRLTAILASKEPAKKAKKSSRDRPLQPGAHHAQARTATAVAALALELWHAWPLEAASSADRCRHWCGESLWCSKTRDKEHGGARDAPPQGCVSRWPRGRRMRSQTTTQNPTDIAHKPTDKGQSTSQTTKKVSDKVH